MLWSCLDKKINSKNDNSYTIHILIKLKIKVNQLQKSTAMSYIVQILHLEQ